MRSWERANNREDLPGLLNLRQVVKRNSHTILTKLRDLLQPVAKAVDTLQGDQYPTLCWVQVTTRVLLNKLTATMAEEAALARAAPGQPGEINDRSLPKANRIVYRMAKLMKESLEKRFAYPALPLQSGYMPIEYVAAFLHPLTKNLRFLRSDAERELVWRHVADLVGQVQLDGPEEPAPVEAPGTAGDDDIFAEFCKMEENVEKNVVTSAEAEVLAYKQEDSAEKHPLNYWRINEVRFPRLAHLARNYLAIPASSAPVERLFSRAGNNQTLKRTRLGELPLNAQTCFAINEPFAEYARRKKERQANEQARPKRRAEVEVFDGEHAPEAKRQKTQ